MTFVFFVYGLSFFVLGLTILIYPKKGSVFKLAGHLYLIAGFGLVHGINEWVDMFILTTKPDSMLIGTLTWTAVLENPRMLLLPGSFLFLVLFGTRVVCETKKRYSLLKALPILLAGLWVVIFAAHPKHFLMGDIWARYLLCVPGTVLTAYGLLLYLPQLEKTWLPVVVWHLKLAGVVFLVYGFLAGLIVPEADFFPASVLHYDVIGDVFGVPVQVFRAVCASIMAYSTYRVLRIFRWETQNALRQSELRFRTIAAAAPVILFMEDPQGLITFLEGKGLDSLGVKSQEYIGKPMSTLFPQMPQIRRKGLKLQPGETYNSHITAEDMTLDLCYSPVQDVEGETAGFIGVALDITQHTIARAELERNRQEMIKTKHLTELGAISTAMTREIERPLKITQLLLQRLLKDIAGPPDPHRIAKTLEKSFTEVNEAVSVLTRFCDFARLSSAAQSKPIDLQRFVKRVMAVCAASAERVNLHLETKDLDVVPSIFIPETELEYVFLILIQNAIDAADPDKPESLTICCEMSDKHIRLTFADTCRAIPPDRIKNIFQPFFTEHHESKEAGFSLAIVNHIVSTCGGAINVESTPPRGTTFHLTLPIDQIYRAPSP